MTVVIEQLTKENSQKQLGMSMHTFTAIVSKMLLIFREYGFNITDEEVRLLMQAYDRNKDGTIDYEEFLRGVRVSFVSFLLFESQTKIVKSFCISREP